VGLIDANDVCHIPAEVPARIACLVPSITELLFVLALDRQGLKVGLLDADIYGPSIPTMLDIHVQPEVEEGVILPIDKFGLKSMSESQLLILG